MGVPPRFSAIYTKGDNFCDFYFTSLSQKMFQSGSTLNPIALRTAKTLSSFGRSECNRVKKEFDPDAKGGKHENSKAASSESVSIHLKSF